MKSFCVNCGVESEVIDSKMSCASCSESKKQRTISSFRESGLVKHTDTPKQIEDKIFVMDILAGALDLVIADQESSPKDPDNDSLLSED